MISEILKQMQKDEPEHAVVSWLDKNGAPQCAVFGTPIVLSYLLKISDIAVTNTVCGEKSEEAPILNLDEKN